MSQKCYVSCFLRLEEGHVRAQHRCCLAGRGVVLLEAVKRRDADVSSLQWDDFIPSCSMRLRKSSRLQDDLLPVNHLAANLFNLHVWLPGWLCWLWCCCFPQGNRFHGWAADRLTSWLTYLLFPGGQRPQGTDMCTHTQTHIGLPFSVNQMLRAWLVNN